MPAFKSGYSEQNNVHKVYYQVEKLLLNVLKFSGIQNILIEKKYIYILTISKRIFETLIKL